MLARIADLRYWLQRYLDDDTVLALELWALMGDEYPELAEMGGCLRRVQLLLNVHLHRLEGAEIVPVDGEYVVKPLPVH